MQQAADANGDLKKHQHLQSSEDPDGQMILKFRGEKLDNIIIGKVTNSLLKQKSKLDSLQPNTYKTMFININTHTSHVTGVNVL